MTDVAAAAEHPMVRAALQEAGWYETFSADAEQFVEALRDDGYSIVPAAIDALRQLGGLRIKPPRHEAAAFASGEIVIDPVLAATGEAGRIQQREAQFGTRLCPIGEWSDEYILLVADDGSILAETTFEVRRVGRNLAEALTRMILADDRTEQIG